MTKGMNQTAIYARKSSESEDRQVLSIDSQIRELTDLAHREGLVIGSVLTESKSAKSPDRPVFNELYTKIQTGRIDSIVCWKLDRLARNPVDGGAIIWAMEEGKLKTIHTPGRTFENTANDKFWMQLEFGMAKKYVDDLSDNVRRGMRAKLELGWLPGLPPLGYLNDRNNRTIVRDPERFPLVRRMWDLMLSGTKTPPQILRVATNQWGLRTRKFKRQGDCALIDSMVQKIFRNPFYCGVIRRKGEDYPGAHEAMVTRTEFNRVQDLLMGRQHPRPKQRVFPFTGLMQCGECGAAITAEQKRNRQGHEYVYYHCTKRKAGIRCSQRVIEAKHLEGQIEGFLASVTLPEEFKSWAIALVREVHHEEVAKDHASSSSLHRRYEACKTERASLVDLRLRGLVTDDEFVSKKNQLVQEQLRLKELLDDGEGRVTEVLDRCIEAFDFATVVQKTFTSGSPEVKKACLQYVGSNLTLRDGILNICPRTPFGILQKVIKGIHDGPHTFEPANLGQAQPRTDSAEARKSMWWALRYDVRTLFHASLGNSAMIKMPEVLKQELRTRLSFQRAVSTLLPCPWVHNEE
jgi:site-specific DNA recombinase